MVSTDKRDIAGNKDMIVDPHVNLTSEVLAERDMVTNLEKMWRSDIKPLGEADGIAVDEEGRASRLRSVQPQNSHGIACSFEWPWVLPERALVLGRHFLSPLRWHEVSLCRARPRDESLHT